MNPKKSVVDFIPAVSRLILDGMQEDPIPLIPVPSTTHEIFL
jgi:hypothetical protein